jgi:hypothetical protein
MKFFGKHLELFALCSTVALPLLTIKPDPTDAGCLGVALEPEKIQRYALS